MTLKPSSRACVSCSPACAKPPTQRRKRQRTAKASQINTDVTDLKISVDQSSSVAFLILAFRAGADFAQILPRIDPVLMSVRPRKRDGVLARGCDFQRLQRLVKDGQSSGSELGG